MTFDQYFMSLADTISLKSPCHSRKIGALLVWNKIIIATGYNGPPRGVPHCVEPRVERDPILQELLIGIEYSEGQCPRRILKYNSGEGLELCPATHAEANCIAMAALSGHHTDGTTLYINTVVPCRECLKLLINAGVHEIVVKDRNLYDKYSRFLLSTTRTVVREYKEDGES